MQINAPMLIASQGAVAEAPARALVLDKSFAPLPLKQTAETPAPILAPAVPTGPARLGSTVDIKV